MFTRRSRSISSRRQRIPSRRAKLFLQALEQRDVPATFMVTNTNDGAVTAPGDLPGSLRQAIFDANANGPGSDLIDLTGASGTLNMAASIGDFVISSNMTLTGPGAGSLTIKGAGDSRIFYVSDDATTTINVSMSGMTLTDGAPQVATGLSPDIGSGGAILVRNEILSLDSMVITNSKTPTVALNSTPVWYHGGAIAMSLPPIPGSSNGQGGSLTINNCQIESNTGGTFNPGVLMAGNGGGIYFNFPNKGGIENTFMMTNSTVSGNVSAQRGGGIYFTHYNGQPNSSFTMINSTVSSNTAQNEFGGGVVISGTQSEPIFIINSTITNNSATSTNGGGGLALNSNGTGSTTNPTIESSIIADNFGTTSAPDIYSNGASVLGKSNIYGSTIGFSSASGSVGNTTGSALLAPLANNGGLVKTHLPRSTSPAIDTGSVAIAQITTLSSAVSSTTIGFITVTAPSVVAVGQQFQIDSEIMTATGISASTITVTRGASGSTAATHASNAALKPVVISVATMGASSVTAAATAIPVVSNVGVTVNSAIQIENEIMWVTSLGGATTINVTRGKNGTSAATHAAGMSVRAVVVTFSNLNVAIAGAGDTTISLFNAQRIGVGSHIQIDSEVLKVTAVSGNVLTVLRGQNATSAVGHVVNSLVQLPYEARGSSFPRIVTGTGGPRVDAGAVEYNVTVPSAFATAPNETVANVSDNTITVVFTAQSPATVDTTTLNNVFVTGPNGFNSAAVPVSNTGTASSVTATYTITAPVNGAAGWDFSDNGTYSIQVTPNTVKDSSTLALNTTVIGQFKTSIGRALVVDNVGDSDDSNYGVGQLTLREAIILANASTGGLDSISFDTATMGASSIAITSQMTISDSVVINPAGTPITLDAGLSSRFFNITGVGVLNVSMTGMTMQNGQVLGAFGGAILLDSENLTLTDCAFISNNANANQFFGAGAGGAIAASGVFGNGSLTLVRNTFTNNISGTGSVGNVGGAIYLGNSPGNISGSFDLSITDSSFTNNTAQGNSGGAISMGSGSLRISGTTFENNIASGSGGAISMAGTLGANGLLIKNSTISGNTSQNSTNGGGGLFLNVTYSVYGTKALIANTTITRNTALSGPGGGINLGTGSASNFINLESSIVAQNSAPSFGWDVSSLGTSSVITLKSNYSLIGILDSTSKLSGVGNQTGTSIVPLDPILQPIANNGGLTRTHKPYGGSPVVDTTIASTTLSAGMTNVATTGTVVSVTNIAVGAHILIDSEIMRVTAVNTGTLTLTVVRAQLGTVAAAHSSAATVSLVPTTIMTALSANMLIGDATFAVTSNAHFTVGMYLTIDTEIMLVTAVSGTTLTVARAQNATVAAAHSSGASCFQTYDQRGSSYPRVQNTLLDLGAVEIDNLTPAAKATSLPVVSTAGGTVYNMVITYTDNSAVDGTTIKTNNIRVTPPSGPDFFPTFVASTPDNGAVTSALTYAATYTFTPPGGAWDTADNGNYKVFIDPTQVADLNPTYVEAHQIGTLKVGIAGSFVVTNANDSGPGSLRDAIAQSNNNQFVTDTISFDTGLFNISTPQTITLGSELLITDQVIITGPGAAAVSVSGNNASRVFTIDTPSNSQAILLSGMTITKGNGVGTVDSFIGGGGILNQDEALTIENCVITGNSVTTVGLNQGGGIALNAAQASLTMRNSTLSNNFATGAGGGLEVRYVNNIINIQNCTISGNSTGTNGSGAGLDFSNSTQGSIVNPDTITIDNSTFFNNVAGSSGGAIRFGSGNGTSRIIKIAVTNSTFNNNVSFSTGGAISLGGATEFTLLNSTISGNYALVAGGGIGASPSSSIYTALNAAIVNSVISGNTNKFWPDIFFGGTTNGLSTTTLNIPVVSSFIGAVDSATALRLDNQGSSIGTLVSPLDAKLGPLAFNGGTVKTMMPLPGSPLIGAGADSPVVGMTKMTAANTTTGTTTVGASSITTSATTIGVTSAAGIGIGSEIQIDNEFMFVNNVVGNTLTVIRGSGTSGSGNGSSAATHAAGATVLFDNGVRVIAPYWTYVGLPIQVDSEVMTVVQTNGVGVTTLSQAAGIGTGNTTFTLGSSSGIPNPTIGYNGQLVLDPGTASAETVTITALSSNTVTVTRGGTPFAHAFGSSISNLSSPLPVNRAQANTVAAAHSAGASVNRAAVRFLAFLGAGGMDGVSSPTTVTVSDSRWMFAGDVIQIDSETMTVTAVPSTTSVTVTRTAPAAHSAGAIINRPMLATDARGSARMNGTIDIGAVEVDPTLPQSQATFADITTAGGSSYSFNVVYTDDVGINTASFNSNNLRVTAPDGVTTIAVTYNPGDYTLGVGSATVKYSIPAVGGTWDSGDDGFYDISIKSGTAVTDSSANPVAAASLGNMHVAIVKSLVVTNTNDTGAGSLRQAIIDANANVGVVDVITFDSTTFNSPQTIGVASGQLEITDPVTIIGTGQANVIIDAFGLSRVLDIKLAPQYWTSVVTMKGLTIANGKLINAQGAGILDEAGGLTIDSVTLTGNSTNGTGGGAIQMASYYSPLIVSNSLLQANTAGAGTGIYIGSNGSGVNAISGQTNFNTALAVSISNTTFDSNSGSTTGTGLRIDSGAVATISNCTFTNNTATGTTGGALAVNGSSVIVNNSTFTGNLGTNTNGNNGSGLYFGGAATATVTNSNISSNTAGVFGSSGGNGAGVFVTGTANVTLSNDTINNNISNSTATTGGGGGLFMSGTTSTVTINNSSLNNNQTFNNGGGAFVSGGNLTINNSTVNNNFGNSPYDFASSTVGQGGGALFMTGSATVTVNSSTLAGNTAPLNGGAIMATALTTAATASGTLFVNNSTISGNTAGSTEANSGGGGLFISGAGGMVLLTNTTVSGNTAASLGGGVLAGGGATTATFGLTSTLAIRNSTIAKNTATGGGGGINFNIAASNTTVTLSSTIVSDNISTTASTGNDLRTGSASTKFNTFNTLVGDTLDFGPGGVAGALMSGPATLGALTNNGGPTQTHSLLGGSTAINAGSNATDLLTTVGATSIALGATTIQVTSAAMIGIGTRLQIDSEIMTVSAISTNTITVNRAQQGTIAATHASGANINFSSLLGGYDQRGPNYARASGVSADIGAFEFQYSPTVTSVVFGDGTSQRSLVKQIVVTFSEPVNFTGSVANAFTLFRSGTAVSVPSNPTGNVTLIATPATGPAGSVTLTFSGSFSEFGSLIDGFYDFTIDAAQISGVGGALDGNNDTIPGGNYAVIGNTGNMFFRLYGDGDGNGVVNQADFIAFRNAFNNGPSSVFDFENDGNVTQSDFIQFRNRFNLTP